MPQRAPTCMVHTPCAAPRPRWPAAGAPHLDIERRRMIRGLRGRGYGWPIRDAAICGRSARRRVRKSRRPQHRRAPRGSRARPLTTYSESTGCSIRCSCLPVRRLLGAQGRRPRKRTRCRRCADDSRPYTSLRRNGARG